MASFKIGHEGKIYYKEGGVAGVDPFAELTNARDVTLNLEATEADVTTRASGGWKWTAAAMKDASIEWESIWDSTDAGFTAILNAFLDGEPIGLQVLDGPNDVAGNQGLEADFSILKITRAEPLEDAMKCTITAKPTYSDTAPEWITTTGS